MNFPVFDLHCDTALALLGKELTHIDGLRQNNLMIDLERASKLSGYAQCFACFTTPMMEQWFHKTPVAMFELELAAILSQIEKNADRIHLAYSAEEIEENYRNQIQSAMLTIEGAAGFGYDPALLEDLYNIGFRISTLGWNESNLLCGSHVTGEGLTDAGKEYVKEAQRLGILVDVSHLSDQGFWDIMNMTDAPVIASHSNSRAVYNISRNITDDMFRQICSCGGVVGFNMFCDFVGDSADLDSAVDHFIHFAQMDPECKHLALGGDLDGCDSLIQGVSGIDDYPKLAQKLLDRGFSKENVMDIFWNNAIGVMKRAVHNHKK